MRLFSKEQVDDPKGSSIKRVSTMETVAIKGWFDTTLMGLGSSYDQWRYHNGPVSDITQHLDILNELWRELLQRDNHDRRSY